MPREVVERRGKTAVGESRGVQAVGQVAELADRRLRRRSTLGQRPPHPVVVATEVRRPQLHREGEQALLRTVVEIPLDPAPLLPLGLGEPTTGALHIAEPARELGAKAGVVELGRRDPRACTDHLRVRPTRVVADPGYGAAVTFDIHPRGHLWRGQTSVLDPGPGLGPWVSDIHERVVEGTPEERS